jgi:hypothetical protein
LRKLGYLKSFTHFTLLREVEKERARTRVRERKLGRRSKRVEIQEVGVKVWPKLSL